MSTNYRRDTVLTKVLTKVLNYGISYKLYGLYRLRRLHGDCRAL